MERSISEVGLQGFISFEAIQRRRGEEEFKGLRSLRGLYVKT